jgi:anti-anti-sigma regulatory factor
VVLDFEAIPYIDSQGSEQLSQIQQLVSCQGATLRLGRVKPRVMAMLERDGVIDRIGADHVHGNIHRALEAELAAERLRA